MKPLILSRTPTSLFRLQLAASLMTAVILGLTGCSKPKTLTMPSVASRSSVIVYVKENEGGYELRAAHITTNTEKTIAHLPSLPIPVFLDISTREVYYRINQQIWRVEWTGSQGTPQEVGALPPIQGQLIAIWVEKSNGLVRALEMQQNEARILPDGTRAPVEPPDATPYICTVWELTPSGNWTDLKRINTSWDADGSPGYSVADDLRHERGWSTATLNASSGCESEICDTEPPSSILQALPKMPPDQAPDEYRLLKPTGNQNVVAFGVRFGDRWHPTQPMFLLRPTGEPKQIDFSSAGAVRLSMHDDYLLIADEDSGKNAFIVDTRNGQVIWRAVTNFATWLPQEFD